MYLLDTNVLSELRKRRALRGDVNVLNWAREIPTSLLYLSTITIFEIELGTLLLERRDGHQGAVLRVWLEQQVLPSFSGRILPVDAAVARQAAALHVPNPRPERDALIAATALVHRITVVTRNTSDSASTGVQLLNPWLPPDG
jgi:predicted nucleic acid-binding protein